MFIENYKVKILNVCETFHMGLKTEYRFFGVYMKIIFHSFFDDSRKQQSR